MGQLATMHKGATLGATHFTGNQLQIIKRTVAPGLNDTEFDMFIEQARLHGLNPIKKEIYGLIYMRSKKNDDGSWGKERQLTLITSIDGFRIIAERTGQYRPDENPPRYEKCEVTTGNPKGIESATVTVYKMDSKGNWHPATATAYWDEFAPIDRKTGAPTGKWKEMPRLMLAKCAEAQALRKAFPDALGGLYEDTEMMQAESEKWDNIPASEIVATQDVLDRRQLLGESLIPITWGPMEAQVSIAVDQLHGKLIDYYRTVEPLSKLEWFLEANSYGLKQFWAEKPEEALDAKKAREEREKTLKEQEAEA